MLPTLTVLPFSGVDTWNAGLILVATGRRVVVAQGGAKGALEPRGRQWWKGSGRCYIHIAYFAGIWPMFLKTLNANVAK